MGYRVGFGLGRRGSRPRGSRNETSEGARDLMPPPPIARKDYEQRRERQAQGIEKVKAAGKYQGRPVDEDLHKRVLELLRAGLGIRATARYANCSTTTVLRICDLIAG